MYTNNLVMHSSKASMRMNMHTRLSVHAFEHRYTHAHTQFVSVHLSVCPCVWAWVCVCACQLCFLFRYTSGDCLIDIVSQLWECLSHRWLFSHGNSEVMHSACVCILSVVLFISDTLLVIVSSILFLRCGGVCLVDNYLAMETVR